MTIRVARDIRGVGGHDNNETVMYSDNSSKSSVGAAAAGAIVGTLILGLIIRTYVLPP